jgi:hypothetical protein
MPAAAQTTDEQWLSDISTGITGAKIAGNVVSPQSSTTKALGAAGNVAGIVSGLKEGGVTGYGGAAVNAGQLLGRFGTSAGLSEEASGDILEGANVVGAGLSLYNFAENYQSGATGPDALRGAEAGAAVGSVVPVVGTVLGAVIGGVVGAISSAFGPGKKDPEQNDWDYYFSVYKGGGTAAVSDIPPAAAYQTLAGIFDARSSDVPFYNQFGRGGEGSFLTSMTGQINQALAKGTITTKSTPQQIYSAVVGPWINGMPGASAYNQSNGYQGDKPAVQDLVTSLIGQYTAGQQGQWTGIDGTVPNVQKFGALGTGSAATKAQQAQTAQVAETVGGQLSNFPTAAPGSTKSGNSLSLLLAIPALGAAGGVAGAIMANPVNPSATTATATQGLPAAGAGTDPTGDAGSAASSSSDPSFLSSLGSDVGSFLSSPLGTTAEFATLGAAGLYEANQQKQENDQLSASIAAPGAPYTAAGAGELSQLEGGPSVGGALGQSITDQTTAAGELAGVAKTYGGGNLTAAQSSQVQQFVAQQRAQVDAQLAASGNIDSSAQEAAYQQIDNNAEQLSQSLISQNTSLAEGALTSVTTTYNNLLTQALNSSEFGLGATEAAVQTQIQSDTALAGQLQSLFAGIATGFGSALGGGKSGSSGTGVGSAAGAAAGAAAKGVASSGSGGGTSTSSVAQQGQAGEEQLDQQTGTDLSSDIDTNADTQIGISNELSGDFQSSTEEGSDWLSQVGSQTPEFDFGEGDPFGG